MHILASNYHWSKSQMDEIYPEDAGLLMYQMSKEKEIRQENEYKARRLRQLQYEYTLISIIHGNPKDTAETLKHDIDSLVGDMQWTDSSSDVSSATYNPKYDDDLPDLEALGKLKQTLKGV